MKIKKEIEIIKSYEDGCYALDNRGIVEYWQIKDNEIVLNATISNDQITLIKNDKGIQQSNTHYLDKASKIDKEIFNFAINKIKEQL